jgi:hypothetical protein
MLAADQRQQGLRLSLHPVNLHDLDRWIFRQPEVSLFSCIALVGAQDQMLFRDLARTIDLMG